MAKALACAGLGALIVAGLAASPALFARDARQVQVPMRAVPIGIGGAGFLTPASADPKLAAIMARSGIATTGFRFTPTEGKGAARVIEAAAIARVRSAAPIASETAPAAVKLPAPSPIAYNLSPVSLSKRLAAAADLGRIESPVQPGARERLNVAGSRKQALRAAIGMDHAIVDLPRFSGIDAGDAGRSAGAVRLMRNLDVTAGMEARSEKERLLRTGNDRRDSQAVYVGTAFRF